jgi:hypothetical protein
MSEFLHLDNNLIGSKGCEYLTKANWLYIKFIQLGIFEMFRWEPDKKQRLPSTK